MPQPIPGVQQRQDQASWLIASARPQPQPPALSMYLRKRTIPSRIRSLAFELLELVARPKGAFVFSKGCGVTSTRIAGCGAGAGADMRAQAQRSLASQDRTHLPPAHLGVAAPRGHTIFHAAFTTAANK